MDYFIWQNLLFLMYLLCNDSSITIQSLACKVDEFYKKYCYDHILVNVILEILQENQYY